MKILPTKLKRRGEETDTKAYLSAYLYIMKSMAFRSAIN